MCSICGFKEKPQQATANVEISLRGIQASHQSQQPHYYSRLFNYLFTNISNSANAPFFLYTEGAIVPEGVTHLRVDHSVAAVPTRAFAHHHQLKEVVLPEGIQEIGVRAFRDCLALECINFPSTLTAIGFGAFAGCVSLTEVELDLSNKVTTSITTIGNWAFQRCTSLERIAIPSTLTAIGAGVFNGCISLKEVKLCEGLQRIEMLAFRNCTSLEQFQIPSTVSAIGDRAFHGCVSLREVKLVVGIQDIGRYAFTTCRSLEPIAVPSKAFVIETGVYLNDFGIETEYHHNCRLLTDGTITPEIHGQVVVASSECLMYMSVTGLAEVQNAINEIINSRERSRDENLERIRVLFAHYELERRKEVTTILELALWKAKVDESKHANTSSNKDEHHCHKRARIDDLNARKECRVKCGADIIIPDVLSFL